MRCPEVKQQILTFLDGETGRHEEQSFYKHLATCCDCSEYLDEARHMNRLLEKTLVHIEPPEDFVQKVMLALPEDVEFNSENQSRERTPGRGAKTAGVSRWRVPGALRNGIAASIAAVLLVGGLGFTGSASMDDSFAKRVFLASREGFRRVVDNVFNIAPDKPIDPSSGKSKPEQVAAVPEKTEKEEATVVTPAENKERQQAVALNDIDGIDSQGQEQRVLPIPPKKSKEDARAEVFSTVGDTMPILPASVSPVVVNDSIDNARPLWVSNKKVYYLSESRSPKENTFVIWETDPKGSSRKMLSSAGYSYIIDNGGGVWSPDNKNIAFVVNKNGYWEIVLNNLKGYPIDPIELSENEKPYEGALWEYNPVVSSQGEIAFLTSRFHNTDLMALDEDGKLRILTQTPEIENNPAWSPDGEKIAYYSFTISGEGLSDGKIFVADKQGNNVSAITPGMPNTGMVPAWSPDGGRIAVNLYSQDESDKTGIWLVNSDGSGWKQVSKIGGGKVIRWSPDGNKVAFTDTNGQLLVLELPSGEGSTGRLILVEPTDQNGEVNWVSWGPDSKQLMLEWKGEQNKTLAIWRADLPQ